MGIQTLGRVAALLVALVSAAPARAHDYWLEESRVRGQGVSFRMKFGEHFGAGEEKGLQRRRIKSFRLLTSKEDLDLLPDTRENAKPAARVPAKQVRSGALVAMERLPARITLDHDRFNRYLVHEGLDAITALREEKRWTRRAGREEYTRHLKLLIPGEKGVGDLADREVGHRLEILFDADPTRLPAGGELPVRVRFEQAPLPNATVDCLRRGADGKVHRERRKTDAEGRVSFPLGEGGIHVVRLVHMRSLGESADFKQPEWASDWAAYSFRIGPAKSDDEDEPEATPKARRKKKEDDD